MVASTGSKIGAGPDPDVELSEEFFVFIMVEEKVFNHHSLLLANACPEPDLR